MITSVWEKTGMALVVIFVLLVVVAMIAFVIAFIFVCVWLISLTAHASVGVLQ